MKFVNIMSLATLVAAAPLELSGPPSVEVKVEKLGSTKMKAIVASHNQSPVKLLKLGTILDDTEVEKAQVFSGDNALKFEGVHLYLDYENLPDNAFIELPPNGTVENTFDVAKFHDLSAGGEYNIDASGFLQYAEVNSNKIVGSISFESSFVSNVNGTEAMHTFSAFQAEAKRALVNRNTCKGSKLNMAKSALSKCKEVSQKAAKAARSGPSKKMKEYFKSDSSATRKTVGKVFDKIASGCSTSTKGKIHFSCENTDFCKSGAATAYAFGDNTVFCPYWFNNYGMGAKCHEGDKPGIIIHEFSHTSSVKGTSDYGGYGYKFVRSLPAAKNINHADTYMLFANAIRVGC